MCLEKQGPLGSLLAARGEKRIAVVQQNILWPHREGTVKIFTDAQSYFVPVLGVGIRHHDKILTTAVPGKDVAQPQGALDDILKGAHLLRPFA